MPNTEAIVTISCDEFKGWEPILQLDSDEPAQADDVLLIESMGGIMHLLGTYEEIMNFATGICMALMSYQVEMERNGKWIPQQNQ